jgi:hypothetical protein
MAVPVVAVLPVEGCQVELVDHVEDEPGEMAGGEPVAQVGGSRKGWSRSPRRKLYAIAYSTIVLPLRQMRHC